METLAAQPLVSIKRALHIFFSHESSVLDAEDPAQFRAQILRHDDDGGDLPELTIDNVLVGVSKASYVYQLAVIITVWHGTGTNPLLQSSETTDAALTIEGVTPEFSSRSRVLALSIDFIRTFVAAVTNSEDEEDVRAATASLVDQLGGARGILTLLGFQQTVGSRNLAPLTLRQCLDAFGQRHTPTEPLTVGARAFSKHCARSASGWWEEMKGNDAAKNARAERKVRELLTAATWKNVHSLPHAHATLETRNALGYGARWDAETGAFRGFLEPPMVNGHEIKWRH
ncbi:hypothetical protein PR003_g792 [Phytophthora rubi]|uniref:Uncharacterized protein n=1 Tax=Phytophthora rubi TaxID=129364 RepID=A0A6A3NRI4_9STRA|nr:hypothetical protein PR002_g712 [Phytophthora rubi]KAE9052115.1 hypothetical protein PR001_g822 [Phytophthora rubi]KAE9359340.1 hypothetical protein PR003_g792 [Phytophthora rubi]